MVSVRIIICGFGRVGRAFADLLTRKEKTLQTTYGLNLQVAGIVDIGGAALSSKGIDLKDLLAHLERGRSVEEYGEFGKRGLTGPEVLASSLGDLLVETTPTNILTGEPGLTHICTALSHGLHVVTAAKGPLVLKHRELKSMARQKGVRLMISAATAAALPTLDVAFTSLAGAEILKAEGILNGTTNYILTRMHEDNVSYAEALEEAQKMGVAEPDPSLDVEGRDTANKILLIANEVFGADLTLQDVLVEGILGMSSSKVQQAKTEGRVIKLIGRIEKHDSQVKASVAPVALPGDHPLCKVRGTEKAISYLTDTMDWITVSGGKSSPLGAAAAILKDIINIYKRPCL